VCFTDEAGAEKKTKGGTLRGRDEDGGDDDDDDDDDDDEGDDEDEDEDEDEDDEKPVIETARFTKGQRAFLVDGGGSGWGSVVVTDGEYKHKMPDGWKGKPKDFPMVRGGESMKIATGWTDTPLFKYSKKSGPQGHGVLKIDYSPFEKTMSPKLLKEEEHFLIDVQHLATKKPVVKKAISKKGTGSKPPKKKAKSIL
jgi:hypothetical protein